MRQRDADGGGGGGFPQPGSGPTIASGLPWPCHLRRARLILPLLAALASAAQAAEPPRRASTAAIEAARRFLCPHGGTLQAGPRGRGRCRPGGGAGVEADDPAVIGWDRGLPPAGNRQAPCPPGTEPVAALAWNNAVRCLPR